MKIRIFGLLFVGTKLYWAHHNNRQYKLRHKVATTSPYTAISHLGVMNNAISIKDFLFMAFIAAPTGDVGIATPAILNFTVRKFPGIF